MGAIRQSCVRIFLASTPTLFTGGFVTQPTTAIHDCRALYVREEFPMLLARDVMTKEVQTIDADATLDELRTLLVDRGISGVLVVEGGRPIGVVSSTDLLRAGPTPLAAVHTNTFYASAVERGLDIDELDSLSIEQGSSTQVREIMTPLVFDVADDAPVQEVAAVMARGRIHRVMVTRNKKFIGIITALDLVRVLSEIPITP